MKKLTIEIDVFEKGDRVLTPEGISTVVKNEIVDDINYRKIYVILDEPSSSYPTKGKIIEMESKNCIIIK